ncbi:hypothetical protein F511_14779 [Dorcoceras hygrometricum]|uniref:Uncharacterized protein n=1 Tax=Dorcoceras hygrometricum TaxID=472368 RepID=A0A2Z7C2L2_9LAMI|nr:hypothetical protein F511_14779 [Dorcoceras hygrometricum]
MSLFDLQEVCIVIGSLATLDLPMVVDLIGVYVLKGPYCTLTMTNWFLQALSVIPRGSWGDEDLPPPTFQEPEFPVNLVGARRLDASKPRAAACGGPSRAGRAWWPAGACCLAPGCTTAGRNMRNLGAMLGARWWLEDAAHGAASVRPCAARCVGDGRHPTILVAIRRLFCLLGFVSGLSRAAHEVFGPIFDIGTILVGPKLILKFLKFWA